MSRLIKNMPDWELADLKASAESSFGRPLLNHEELNAVYGRLVAEFDLSLDPRDHNYQDAFDVIVNELWPVDHSPQERE